MPFEDVNTMWCYVRSLVSFSLFHSFFQTSVGQIWYWIWIFYRRSNLLSSRAGYDICHPCLVDLLTFLKVLDSHHTLLTEAASWTLESHWPLKTTTSGLPFSQVLTGVQRSGADAAVLSLQKWPVSSMPYIEDATTLREDYIRRLIILANACTW